MYKIEDIANYNFSYKKTYYLYKYTKNSHNTKTISKIKFYDVETVYDSKNIPILCKLTFTVARNKRFFNMTFHADPYFISSYCGEILVPETDNIKRELASFLTMKELIS